MSLGGPGNVTFTVSIQNNDPSPVQITKIEDTVFGNLDGKGSCKLSDVSPLAANGTYMCSFTEMVGPGHQNTVQVEGTIGNRTVSGSDDATIAQSVPLLGPLTRLGPSWGLLALFFLLLSVGAWLAARGHEISPRR